MPDVLAEAPAIRRPRFTRVIRRALMMRIVGSGDGAQAELDRWPHARSGGHLALALTASRELEADPVDY